MGKDVKKEYSSYDVKDLEYKGKPLADSNIDYTMPDNSNISPEYYPDELLAVKEFSEFSEKLNMNGYNHKFAKKLFSPVSFKRKKLVPGTEDNPKYETEYVSLSANQTIDYIKNNNKSDFFREVTRSGNEGFHFVAFCESKGLSVKDMEYALDHPNTELGRQIDHEMDKCKEELYEMMCSEDPVKKKEQFTKFYADYVESQTEIFSDIIKNGDIKFDELPELLKHAGSYQSILVQTLNLGSPDKKRKENAEEFVKGVEAELKNRGSEATFSGLTPFVNYCNTISQNCAQIHESVKSGKYLDGPNSFRQSTKGQATISLLAYNSMRNFIKGCDKENPAKYLAQITDDQVNDLAEEFISSPIWQEGFDSGNSEGRQYLADNLPEIISQKTGKTVDESQAKGLMNDSLARLNNFAKKYENDPKYAPIINDIISAGKNFASKTGPEKVNAQRDLKLMSSLLIAGVKDSEIKREPEIAELRDCSANILAASNAMQKTIELDAQGIDVIDQSDAPAYDEANRMLEENFADRMGASQKKIFGKSSPQFTEMQTALEEYNKFNKGINGKPTPEQKAKQREQILNIKKLSAEYIGVKENQKLTKNGQERFQLAKEVNSYFDKAYINSMDGIVEEMIKNPNIDYGEKDLPDKLMLGAIADLNNAAFRTALKDVGGKISDTYTLETVLKTAKTVEEFKANITANRLISDKDLYLNNADLLFACHQKDLKDAPERKSRAREMLNNAKYPIADRNALEEFAKANNIKVKDPAGDKKYLENVEKIRQYRIDNAMTLGYRETNGSERWAQTLLTKPGLTDEEKKFIASEIDKPRGERTKLYEYALNEIKNCNADAYNDKSIDELIENFPQENYYRLLTWDRDNMFLEMDEAIQKNNLTVDKTEYKQIKQFVNEANGNSSTLNSKLNQYERNQSMVIDPDGVKFENLMMSMATADSSTKCYLAEQSSYSLSWSEFTGKEELEHKKTQMDIAADPKCIKDKFAEQSKKYWDKAREGLDKLKTEDLFLDEKQKIMEDIINQGTYVMYYNSAKLSADKMPKEVAINLFDPKVRDSKLPDMKASIVEKVKGCTFAELEKAILRDEVDMKVAKDVRSNLNERMQAKEAKKVAEKAAEQQRAMEAREKKQNAPTKAGKGYEL